MSGDAIILSDVTKKFVLPHNKKHSVKQVFINMLSKNGKSEQQTALENINFSVKRGEFFGIVGRNGSGKSTLLKILAGIYMPSDGKITTVGKLVPFIELGVGFNPELSGRENVYLNSALLGFSRKETTEMYDDIVAFAELDKFMDQKLKNYSSGMQVRLAFSLAVRAKADILLIDEVLAVGDADFQRKCFDYFRELKRNLTTVVFVSHDMNAIVEYCDRAALIDSSKLINIGEPIKVAQEYNKLFTSSIDEKSFGHCEGSRWGDGAINITSCSLNKKIYRADKDKKIRLSITLTGVRGVDHNIAAGYLVKNASGQAVLGTNTYEQKIKLGSLSTNESMVIEWEIPNIFGDGVYTATVAVTSSDGSIDHDWWEFSESFRVYREEYSPYLITPTTPVTVRRLLSN